MINSSITIVAGGDKFEFLKSSSIIVVFSCISVKMGQANSPKLFTDKLIFLSDDLHSLSTLHNIIPIEESKEQALKLMLEKELFYHFNFQYSNVRVPFHFLQTAQHFTKDQARAIRLDGIEA